MNKIVLPIGGVVIAAVFLLLGLFIQPSTESVILKLNSQELQQKIASSSAEQIAAVAYQNKDIFKLIAAMYNADLQKSQASSTVK
jgi:hypothetical protein